MSDLVVVLHGLGQRKFYMSLIATRLSRAGFVVKNFGYRSRRHTIATQIEKLREFLLPFKGRRLNFVAHSLGSILARAFVLRFGDEFQYGRLVMLGPPNHGSSFARGLEALLPAEKIWGPVLSELAHLSMPTASDKIEIGVIAGQRSLWPWPFLKGAHDGIVTVEETKLPGMKDFVLVSAVHAELLFKKKVSDLAISFLKSGSFSQGS